MVSSPLFIIHSDNAPLGELPRLLGVFPENIRTHLAPGMPSLSAWPEISCLTGPVIVMGGPMGVGDIPRLPWLRDEVAFLEKILNSNIPLLGVCLGAQLLAHIHGARVMRCPENSMECGYYPTQSQDLPEQVFHWHEDGIELLSSGLTDLGPSPWRKGVTTNAFRHNNILGVQFHPEVNEIMIARRHTNSPHHLTRPYIKPPLSHYDDHRRYAPSAQDWLVAALKDVWGLA